MIEQVIDKEGVIYTVSYPPPGMVTLSRLPEQGFKFGHIVNIPFSSLAPDYRPYKVDGNIVSDGLEPWERWGGDAKERWKTLETIFTAAGYTVSHNGQDMKLEKDGLEDWLSDIEIMNFSPEENFKLVERCMYKPEEGPKV